VLCLPHKRLKVAKKELDSENESALGARGGKIPAKNKEKWYIKTLI
jgi:hypothetical protein